MIMMMMMKMLVVVVVVVMAMMVMKILQCWSQTTSTSQRMLPDSLMEVRVI